MGKIDISRKKHKNALKKLLLFFVIGLIVMALFGTIGFFIIIIGLVIAYIDTVQYKKTFKAEIVSKALKEYDESLIYNPFSGIPVDLYKKGKFEKFEFYKSEDEVQGYINNCKFIMSDVLTEIGQSNIVFSGQVAVVELPMSYGFNVSIVTKPLDKALFNDNYRLEIDNPEFEERYDVYTTDKLKTLKLLTPVTTSKILDAIKNDGFEFEIKLIGDKMYFRFYGDDLFESYCSDSVIEQHSINFYLNRLDCIKEIMNEVIETLKKV